MIRLQYTINNLDTAGSKYVVANLSWEARKWRLHCAAAQRSVCQSQTRLFYADASRRGAYGAAGQRRAGELYRLNLIIECYQALFETEVERS
jgi:hypothetical protein